MGIDSSIPLQAKASVQLMNPMDVQAQAMNMRRLAQQNQAYENEQAQAQTMSNLYKKNVTTDAAGKKKLNQSGVLSDMLGVSPEKHAEYEKKFSVQNLEELKTQADMKKSLAWSMNDEPSYFQARQKAIELGLPNADKMPEQYPGQQYVKSIQLATLNESERLGQEWKQKEYELKQNDQQFNQQDKRFGRGLEMAKLDVEKQKDSDKGGYADGVKKLNTEFAKDYNEWTSGGGSRARAEIDKLDGVVERLKTNKGGTGGLTGVLGDRFTSDDVLKNRADVKQSAMSLIKVLLSGATSDGDRKEVVDTLWNEADSTENNIARIERFSGDMKSRADETDSKVKYFEQNRGNLDGFNSNIAPTGTVKMMGPKGNIRDVPLEQVGEAIAAGGKKI